jgi:hypothetical protein
MSLEALRGRWRGRTVVCIASGPSLTAEDCESVRESGHPTIVVNSSFRLAPWADILFAMDKPWWDEYLSEVAETFHGERWGYVRMPKEANVIATKGALYPTGWGNSGSYAISLAVVSKALKIVLLGYDCKFGADGKKHWHADYPERMGNAHSIKRGPYQFELVAKYASQHGIPVKNCSRDTALTCFERGELCREL